MKTKIQQAFGLTDKGAENVLRSAVYSFLKYFTYILTPMLVFFFLHNALTGHLLPLHYFLAVWAGIFLIMFLIIRKEYISTYDSTYEESVALRVQIGDRFRKLPMSYFSKHNLTDLSQTVMMDVGNVETAISHALPQAIGFVGFFALISLVMLWSNLWMGLAVTLPIWLAGIVLIATRRLHMGEVKHYYQTLLDNAAAFQDAFELQQEIKSYSLQDAVEKEVGERLEESERLHIRSELIMAVANFLVGLLPKLSPVFAATLGAWMYAQGHISLLYFLGYMLAASNLSVLYNSVSDFVLIAMYFKDSFDRIRAIQQEEVPEGEPPVMQSYDFVLEDVRFAYGENPVIQGISLEAKQGQTTALVGPSGCGKTTLMRLLARLYDYQGGSIRLGGQEIKTMDPAGLFAQISIVFQEVELFNASILENIRVGRRDATDAEVLEAARLANVDKIAAKLPQGFQTLIGENGSNLSGGERQRISIARAFLKDAPIVLLDEISASLDVENEIEIQQSISKLIQNKTVIVISHRMASIEKCDRIVVLDAGRVVGCGRHEELEKGCELYRRMLEKSRMSENYVY